VLTGGKHGSLAAAQHPLRPLHCVRRDLPIWSL